MDFDNIPDGFVQVSVDEIEDGGLMPGDVYVGELGATEEVAEVQPDRSLKWLLLQSEVRTPSGAPTKTRGLLDYDDFPLVLRRSGAPAGKTSDE